MDDPIERRSLDGEWAVRQGSSVELGGGTAGDDWLQADVPGDVYHDLLRAGEIPDPFLEDRELDVQWVGERDWTYRRTVEVDAERPDHDAHRLVFEGLDAVATVSLNGEVVGRSENAHRRYAFDVGDALEPGENELVVAFESPVDAARERAEAYPLELGTTHYPIEQPHRNFLRKAQCHFGWDWGVCLPTVGIWRDVELVSFSVPRITDVAVGQDHADVGVADDGRTADGSVELEVDVRTEAPSDGEYALSVEVAGEDVDASATERVELTAGPDVSTVELAVEGPELWWPANHGDQPLYDVAVEVARTDDPDDPGGLDHPDGPHDAPRDGPLDSARERIGFRDVELRREADPDGDGQSFQFVVNGRPTFAGGANWIPADGIPSRVDESDYRRLLEDAVAANMNAIRVWGGGIYEREAFYDACDELGLLVWQDFQFACAQYPANEAFLDSVRAEAEYQVRRLASHPSIALWCGNNEVDELFETWTEPGDPEYDRLREEYDALFRETLGPVVEATDPDDRAYWHSSPSTPEDVPALDRDAGRPDPDDPDAGRADASDPDAERPDPGDPSAGDVHFWEVWHRGEPFSAFLDVEPRFVSEFGYQSFPSVDSLRGVLPEDQLNPTAPLLEHHQRNPGGNARILQRMADHFRVPWSFERFVYLSQVQQALAIRTAVEHWRRTQPRCAGALFWQLNDLWPVASWSAIEHGGRWKALQYAARRFFAPLLVSFVHVDADGEPVGRGSESAEHVEVWVSTDGATSADGTVEVSATRLDPASGDPDAAVPTDEPLLERRAAVDVGPFASERVATVDPGEFDAAPEDVLLRAEFVGEGAGPNGSSTADSSDVESYPAFETLVPYKGLDLAAPDLDVTVDGDEVTVTADATALYVHLDAAPLSGYFSDDYLHLAPGEQRRVTFQRREGEEMDLEASLSVRHLRSEE